MKAIILAGGEGTRLRPLTHQCPKALIPLGEKPFCYYQLKWLSSMGIREVIFSLGYMGDKIRDYIHKERLEDIKVHYVKEETPLGTGGAIRYAADKDHSCDGSPYLVLNGDLLANLDIRKLAAFHHKKGALLSLALVEVKDIAGYGLVVYRRGGKVERFLEKPRPEEAAGLPLHISAGVYIMEREAIDQVPAGQRFSFEKELVPRLLSRSLVYACLLNGYWLDVGTHERYEKAKRDIGHKVFTL